VGWVCVGEVGILIENKKMKKFNVLIFFLLYSIDVICQNSLDIMRIEVQSVPSPETIKTFQKNNHYFLIDFNKQISVGEIRSGKLIYTEQQVENYFIKDVFSVDSLNYILQLEKYLPIKAKSLNKNPDSPIYYSSSNLAKWNLRTNKIETIFDNDLLGQIGLYVCQNKYVLISNYSLEGLNGIHKDHIESNIYRMNDFSNESSLELLHHFDRVDGGMYGIQGAHICHDSLIFQIDQEHFYLNDQDSLIKCGGQEYIYSLDNEKNLEINRCKENEFGFVSGNGLGNELVYFPIIVSDSLPNDKIISPKYRWELFCGVVDYELESIKNDLNLSGKLILNNSEIQSYNFLAIYPKCMDTIIYVWDPEERIPKYWDDINYSKKILLEVSIKSGCNELIVGKTYLGWHSNRGMVSELYYYSNGKLEDLIHTSGFIFSVSKQKLFFIDQNLNCISAQVNNHTISNLDTIAFNCFNTFYERDGFVFIDGVKNSNSYVDDKTFIDVGLIGKILIDSLNSLSIYNVGEYSIFKDILNVEKFRVRFLNNNNWLVKLPNSPYYMCSKDASKMLHYVTPSLKVIGFEQLDPVFNRPDIVLDSIGKYFGGADAELVANYRASWEKRIDRLGLDKEKIGKGEIAVPDAEIVGADTIAYENSEGNLTIKVKASDPKYLLRRFNVYVNEVPLYGSAGISIAHLKKHQWDTTLTVPLSFGENKVQVSVMNELGLENFKYPLYVNYSRPDIESKTYYIGIGVNDFNDDRITDLEYCIKDVRDLGEQFALKGVVDTLLLVNDQVTRSEVMKLKERLMQTTVNDRVIISCSSHGMLDHNNNFYLATYDMDPNQPGLKGIKYEELEWLLDSIPARKKLLLLDACNSGENELDTAANYVPNDIKFAKIGRGAEAENTSTTQNTSLKTMMELFVNVRNNTGSVIISAAGGQQSALEGDAVQINGEVIRNGAFTYSVLEYLKENDTKTNELSVNKLKQYVENRVEVITNGRQKPTSRQETMDVDWKLR
jgi:hypothetical protein